MGEAELKQLLNLNELQWTDNTWSLPGDTNPSISVNPVWTSVDSNMSHQNIAQPQSYKDMTLDMTRLVEAMTPVFQDQQGHPPQQHQMRASLQAHLGNQSNAPVDLGKRQTGGLEKDDGVDINELLGHVASYQTQYNVSPLGSSSQQGSVSSTEQNGSPTANPTQPASSSGNRSPRQSQPKQPGVNLHNKVEKRYRSNVKNALDTLRDSVPRLRQVYGTSLPSETETTDKPDEDGLIGGVGEIGKPTKQTVMVGARMYIEHLESQLHTETYLRSKDEAVLISLMGGESSQAWTRWKSELDNMAARAGAEFKEGLDKRLAERATMLSAREGSGDPSTGSGGEAKQDDEDEEPEAPPVRGRPRKRPREGEELDTTGKKTSQPRAKKSKVTPETTVSPTSSLGKATGAGAAVMYSFGLAYTFFPRASSLFGRSSSSAADPTSSTKFSNGRGGVLFSAPFQAAAHKSAGYIQRVIPKQHHNADFLNPDDLLDWFGVMFLAGILTWITYHMMTKWGLNGKQTSPSFEEIFDLEGEDGEEKAAATDDDLQQVFHGSQGDSKVVGTLKEGFRTLKCYLGRGPYPEEQRVERAWDRLTQKFVGGGESFGNVPLVKDVNIHCEWISAALDINFLVRIRLEWRLRRVASKSPKYALLRALHTKTLRDWEKARVMALDSTDKRINDILTLPKSEVTAIQTRLGAVQDPIRAIGEHLVITRLDDLATRLYISLVEASTSGPAEDSKGKQSLVALTTGPSFREQTIDTLVNVSTNSPAYSLGLVLIGLWSVVGGGDPAARKSVANKLIAAQLRGDASFSSVDALLALVAPGYKHHARPSEADQKSWPMGVAELDTLLEACLRYVSIVRRLRHVTQRPNDVQMRSVLYKDTLIMRQLLGRPAFQRTFKNVSGYKMRNDPLISTIGVTSSPPASSISAGGSEASDSESIASHEQEESISAIEQELEDFDRQTDKLVDVLVEVGQRVAVM